MEWNGITLEQRIVFLINTNQVKSEEFKVYFKIYGPEKIKSFWLNYLQKTSKTSEKSLENCMAL